MLQLTRQNLEPAVWCQPTVEFFLVEMMRFQTDGFGSCVCESRMVTRESVLGHHGNLSKTQQCEEEFAQLCTMKIKQSMCLVSNMSNPDKKCNGSGSCGGTRQLQSKMPDMPDWLIKVNINSNDGTMGGDWEVPSASFQTAT